MSTSEVVYKILSDEDWAAAQVQGRFTGAAVDLADGYIHFSSAAQVRGTLEKWFAGRTGLVLLAVRTDALPEPIRWEPARGGALFPHLYAHLPLSAVQGVWPIGVGPDGRFALPDGL